MKIEDIHKLVIDSLNSILEDSDFENASNPNKKEMVNKSTKLVGRDAVLESIGLVSVIADMEELVEDKFGLTITIADERAMSREKSPFLTVASLSEYILELIQEKN